MLKKYELETLKVGDRDLTGNIFNQIRNIPIGAIDDSKECHHCEGCGLIERDDGSCWETCDYCCGTGQKRIYEILGKVLYPRKIKDYTYFFDLLLEDSRDESLCKCTFKLAIFSDYSDKELIEKYSCASIKQIFLLVQ